jgi:hypothetical protein
MSMTTRRTNAAVGRRAVQARHRVRHGSQATAGYLPATRIAYPVGPLVQLHQCSLGALQAALERLANTDVSQTAHGLRGPIADSLPEAHGAATLGMLCQHPQTLAVTVPARFQFSANSIKVEITGSHDPTIASRGGRGHVVRPVADA